MATVLYILLGIFIFGVIIFIHELGHFLAAKSFHVSIDEFAIGMGPKLISHAGKDGILYSLRLFPIGGFVSMVGEDEESQDENALCKKPVWQRMIITVAGAFMNILLGFVLMGFVVGFSPKIESTTVAGFNVIENGNPVEYQEVLGIRVGDTVKKVGNRTIHVRSDLVYEVMFLGDEPVDVTLERDGETLVLENVSFPTYTQQGVTFGNSGFIRTTELEKTFPEIVKQSVFQSFSAVDMLWMSLLNTLKGKYGTEALSGPVGVIGQVKETAQMGWEAVMFLAVIITLNVGMINLMPLPALDGGRLLFQLIELVRGKPINPKYEGYVHAAGLILLLILMAFITYQDIVRIFFK